MKFILPSAALAVTIAMALCVTTAADFKLSPPVVEGMEYAGIPPYIEVDTVRFDSTIDQIMIDGGFVIDICSAWQDGDRSYIYYQMYAETKSPANRVLVFVLSEKEISTYIYSGDGTIMTGFRWGVGDERYAYVAHIYHDAIFLISGDVHEDSSKYCTVYNRDGVHKVAFENEKALDEATGLRNEVYEGIIDSSWLSDEEAGLVDKAWVPMDLAKDFKLAVPKDELMAVPKIVVSQPVGDATGWIIPLSLVKQGLIITAEFVYGDWREKYYGSDR